MSTKLTGIGTLKEGNYVVLDEAACRVVSTQTSRPGKHGHSKIRLEGIGLIDGKRRVIVSPGHDNIEVPIIEKKTAQVLSINGNMANVMDAETFETFDLVIPDELKADVKDTSQVLFWVILNDRVMKQIKTTGDE